MYYVICYSPPPTHPRGQIYDFDISKLQWEKYIDSFCMGTKRYLLNEDLANLPVARRQITRWVLNGTIYIHLASKWGKTRIHLSKAYQPKFYHWDLKKF